MADVLLVAVDGSEASTRAAKFAAETTAARGAKLVLAHVVDWSPYEFHTPEELETRHGEREAEIARARDVLLQPLADSLTGPELVVETVVRHGHPASELCKLAEEFGAGHIVMGRHGRSKFSELLFGSVAARVAQTAPMPVTIVP